MRTSWAAGSRATASASASSATAPRGHDRRVMLDPSPAVPRASLYLASAEDAEAGCRSVAGLPVAFRAVMAAIHAGCRSVAIPAAYRGTKVERAITRSARARAGAVWLGHGKTDLGCEPMVLLPATAVFPTSAVRALMEE